MNVNNYAVIYCELIIINALVESYCLNGSVEMFSQKHNGYAWIRVDLKIMPILAMPIKAYASEGRIKGPRELLY
jgi:hypothetical protein